MKSKTLKRILFLLVVIISFFVIKNSIMVIYNLWHKEDLITQDRNHLAQEVAKNADYKKQLKQAQSPSFIEEEARNKLFMVKPGENQVILPDSTAKNASFLQYAFGDIQNWQKWLSLFFY